MIAAAQDKFETIANYVIVESGQPWDVAVQVGTDAEGHWRVREWFDSPGPNEPWAACYPSRDAAEDVARQYAEDRDEGMGLGADRYEAWLSAHDASSDAQ